MLFFEEKNGIFEQIIRAFPVFATKVHYVQRVIFTKLY